MNRRQFYKNLLLGAGLVFCLPPKRELKKYSYICEDVTVYPLRRVMTVANGQAFNFEHFNDVVFFIKDDKRIKCEKFDLSYDYDGPHPRNLIEIKLDFEIYV